MPVSMKYALSLKKDTNQNYPPITAVNNQFAEGCTIKKQGSTLGNQYAGVSRRN